MANNIIFEIEQKGFLFNSNILYKVYAITAKHFSCLEKRTLPNIIVIYGKS